MNFHVMTLFPDMIKQGLSDSIIGRAIESGAIDVQTYDIRDYTLNKHRKVDDYPYGGGAGMLMQTQPVYDCYNEVKKNCFFNPRVVYMTPQGKTFNQAMAEELAAERELIILCGHYEGIDERVIEEIVTDEVSIGDFVLTGGEMAAMVVIDAVSRLVPGVLNNEDSSVNESFSGNLLEYPQYSRPEEWNGKRVPEVLLSGNHAEVDKWRLKEAIKRTKEKRPDLYEKYLEEQAILEFLGKEKVLNMDMTESIRLGFMRVLYKKDRCVLCANPKKDELLLYAENEADLEDALAFIKNKRYNQGALLTFRGFESNLPEKYGYMKREELLSAVYTRGVPLNKKEAQGVFENEFIFGLNNRLQRGEMPYYLFPSDNKEMQAVFEKYQCRISKKVLYFYEHL